MAEIWQKNVTAHVFMTEFFGNAIPAALISAYSTFSDS